MSQTSRFVLCLPCLTGGLHRSNSVCPNKDNHDKKVVLSTGVYPAASGETQNLARIGRTQRIGGGTATTIKTQADSAATSTETNNAAAAATTGHWEAPKTASAWMLERSTRAEERAARMQDPHVSRWHKIGPVAFFILVAAAMLSLYFIPWSF